MCVNPVWFGVLNNADEARVANSLLACVFHAPLTTRQERASVDADLRIGYN